MKKYTCISIVICLLLVLVLGPASLQAQTRRGPVPGRFIVRLAPRSSVTAISQTLGSGVRLDKLSPAQFQDKIGGEQLSRLFIYTDSTGLASEADVRRAVGNEHIEYIEPDYYLELYEFPNDSLFRYQWGMFNFGQAYPGILRNPGVGDDSLVFKSGNVGSDINLSPLYASPPSETSRVVVAIIDSGTDIFHPELEGRIWINADEIPANGIDDDHNGFVDDTVGYDISGDIENLFETSPDNDPTDQHGHGTHCSGIVAANANGVGIVGVAPSVEIMPVKIYPNLTTSVGAAGIIYAVNAGADVINVSWGSPFESLLLQEALNYARANGVFVAVASGNGGNSTLNYPAAGDNVFAVGAGNSSGYVTYFSSYGNHVDLVAPGEDILSLRATGTDMYEETGEPFIRIVDSLYYLSDGTSMAAPMAAGAAALLLTYRPDLSLDELEDVLRMGATDLVDPFAVGDTLIGFDSISGWGYLNVAASYNLIVDGGIHLVSPASRSRHTDSVSVRIASVAGYTGGWELWWSVGLGSTDYSLLADGLTVPSDSLIYTLNNPSINGYVNLLLRDDNRRETITTIVYALSNMLELTTPAAGTEVRYAVPVYGSVFGPDYDSLNIYFEDTAGTSTFLYSTSGEYFDSLIYVWNLSGLDIGEYTIVLEGQFTDTMLFDTVSVTVLNSFSAGWPQELGGRGSISPVCADLNHDGLPELIVGTTFGLFVYRSDGTVLDGFPVLPTEDMRCVPAIYDVDKDGVDDIVTTNATGIHAFAYNGSYVSGWPRQTVLTSLNFGFPIPSIVPLGGSEEDSAIVIIDNRGTIQAYNFNGSPHFYSLEGWFANFSSVEAGSYFYSDNSVTTADLDGDNRPEVIATYSLLAPDAGTALFDSRNGQPAWDRPSPQVIDASVTYGSMLADLNGDDLPEIITTGYDTANARIIWVKTLGTQDFPGWPRSLPDVERWLSSSPTVADLDLDGIPEILCTFFEFDIAALYIFRADGTPYVNREGRPAGEAFFQPVTFGVPIVADLLGDEYPEIAIRSGYILPGSGTEKLYVLDYQARVVPGWPLDTPNRPSRVFSSPFAPLIDDVDGDGLVELALISDDNFMYIWDFDASSRNGENYGRIYGDNLNSGKATRRRISTDIFDDAPELPLAFALKQNYPNPFNPATAIAFDVPKQTKVELEVFNILGRRVETLVNGVLPAGRHTVQFDGTERASGVYLYRLRTDDETLTRKMMLLK